ncbi:MAG: L,D-transpeptidase family protein [Smithella sp.]
MKKKKLLIITNLYIIFFAFFLSTASCTPFIRKNDHEFIVNSLKINDSSQALIVTNNCSQSPFVNVFLLKKNDGKWEYVEKSMNGVIGKNGFAAPDEKREGDGKSPSGIFALKTAFGYGEAMRTKMPYRQALADDLWIDDVNADDYNRWVKKDQTKAVSYEKMKRDDDLYKYGFVIEYNTAPVVKGHGSAIFFHVWRGGNIPTEGCVAVSEDNIIKILDWLDPQARPLIIMGTKNTVERLIP